MVKRFPNDILSQRATFGDQNSEHYTWELCNGIMYNKIGKWARTFDWYMRDLFKTLMEVDLSSTINVFYMCFLIGKFNPGAKTKSCKKHENDA